jgi:hypothetical protein
MKLDQRTLVGIALVILGSYIVGRGFAKTGWMK